MSEILGTLLVAVILAVTLGLILISMIRDRRAGKNTCGGDCGGCDAACRCAEVRKKAEARMRAAQMQSK